MDVDEDEIDGKRTTCLPLYLLHHTCSAMHRTWYTRIRLAVHDGMQISIARESNTTWTFTFDHAQQ